MNTPGVSARRWRRDRRNGPDCQRLACSLGVSLSTSSSGRPLRLVSANSSSCFSLMDSVHAAATRLQRRSSWSSPRLADSAAPAAFLLCLGCCWHFQPPVVRAGETPAGKRCSRLPILSLHFFHPALARAGDQRHEVVRLSPSSAATSPTLVPWRSTDAMSEFQHKRHVVADDDQRQSPASACP